MADLPPNLPDYRTDSGLVFGKGAMRGAFQAGVVHAFVLSGIYPTTVAGTSVGALSGAALVTAARLEHQRDRLALVDRLLHEWHDNPGRRLTEQVTSPHSRVRRLADDLLDLRLDLGTLALIVTRMLAGGWWIRLWLGLRLFIALRFWRPRVTWAAVRAIGSVFWGCLRRRGAWGRHGLQGVMSAYGMRDQILTGWVGEHYYPRLAAWLPDHDITLAQLSTHGTAPPTQLLVQVANLSAASDDTDGAAVFTMPQHGRLEHTLRAAVAMAPIYRPVRAEEAMPGSTGELRPTDVLMDAGEVEKMPLTVVVRHWRTTQDPNERQAKKLWVVHHTPTRSGADPNLGYIGSVLRSVRLSEQRDTHFNETITRLITKLTRTIEEDHGTPPTLPGRDEYYVQVEPHAIAPTDPLPPSLSLWNAREIDEAITAGCRAALSRLHADTLASLSTATETRRQTVPCRELLTTLRAPYVRANQKTPYFEPCPRACGGCSGALPVPVERVKPGPASKRLAEPGLPSRSTDIDPNDQPPLDIAVPAGGVFRGVFQVGTIAALRDYGIRPELFAGASVGTLFSFLMEASSRTNRDDSTPCLRAVVDLMHTIPNWVDADPSASTPTDANADANAAAAPVGRVDRLVKQLAKRWTEADAGSPIAAIRQLKPRDVLHLVSQPSPESWTRVLPGLTALFLDPVEGATRSSPPFELDRHRLLHAIFASLDGDYTPLIDIGDQVLQAWGIVDLSDVTNGELIGLQSVAHQLHTILFEPGDPTDVSLADWAATHDVRFLFSGANFEQGKPVVFGQPWDNPSPRAIEAALAASSFPVAFRRRRHDEVFASGNAKPTYVDGGIFNNFPSDTAFAFLRTLSAYDDYQWLGRLRHRVLLLSLDPPTQAPRIARSDSRAMMNWARSRKEGRDDKVYSTWVTQQHITHLAKDANPILRNAGQEQAMMVDFDLIEPVRFEYPHAFAFKDWLGFRRDKQQRLLAAGCRRARVAFEWRKFRADHTPAEDAALPQFNARVREQFRNKDRDQHQCVFGPLSPAYRRDGTLPPCAFVELYGDDERGRQIRRECGDDAKREPDLRSLPIYRGDIAESTPSADP